MKYTTKYCRLNVFKAVKMLPTMCHKTHFPLCAVPSSDFSLKTPSTASSAFDGKVIYTGNLTRMVRNVKLFSLTTSLIGLSFQPMIYKELMDLPIWLAALLGGTVNSFIFISPVLLHWVSKRYVMEIQFDPALQQFKALTYTFFLRKKQHVFKATDVVVPAIPRLFSTVLILGKPMLVDISSFSDRNAMLHMLQYDKPMEWEIPISDLEDNSDRKTGVESSDKQIK